MLGKQEWSTYRKLLFTQTAGGGSLNEYTAEGNPLTFNTNKAKPLRKALATWTPRQEGTGDPSPSNVRPVLGMDGVMLWQTGKNIIDFTVASSRGITASKVDGKAVLSGTASGGSAYNVDFIGKTLPPGTYTASVTGLHTGMECVVTRNGSWYKLVAPSVTFTLTEESLISGYVRTAEGVTIDTTVSIQIEVGSTATDFMPYSGTSYSVAFPCVGKNLLNVADRESGYIASNGKIAVDNSNVSFGYILLKANESYAISTKGTVMNIGVCLYEMDKATVIRRYNNTNKSSVIIDSANADRYMRVWMNYDGSLDLYTKTDAEIIQLFAPQVEHGSTATSYEPYTRTCYGGTLDLTTGVLTATHYFLSLKKTEFINKQHGSSMDYYNTAYIDIPDVKSGTDWNMARQTQLCNICKIANPWGETAYGNTIGVCFSQPPYGNAARISETVYDAISENDVVNFVYEMTTPITVATLSPTQISALLGNNTMWSDADDLSVTYLKKG